MQLQTFVVSVTALKDGTDPEKSSRATASGGARTINQRDAPHPIRHLERPRKCREGCCRASVTHFRHGMFSVTGLREL
ncbi:hypothetical protein H8959_007923 [Pygathrix nigripes]